MPCITQRERWRLEELGVDIEVAADFGQNSKGGFSVVKTWDSMSSSAKTMLPRYTTFRRHLCSAFCFK